MRAAIGQDSLPYQVAPGLSEMPKDSYPELDFQAARVAFLVDGDGGGQRLAETIGRVIKDPDVKAAVVANQCKRLANYRNRDVWTEFKGLLGL